MKDLRSNLQGVKVCLAQGLRGFSLRLDDLQEAHDRGGWSLQGSRRSKRVRSPGPDIPWRTHPTIASLPAPRLISQGSISSQYCLPEKQTFDTWALWEYTLYTLISFPIKERRVKHCLSIFSNKEGSASQKPPAFGQQGLLAILLVKSPFTGFWIQPTAQDPQKM